jgi:hypothetical protein
MNLLIPVLIEEIEELCLENETARILLRRELAASSDTSGRDCSVSGL